MDSWRDMAEFGVLCLFILLTLYMLIHMLVNRYKGKDELDGLFRFRKKRDKND